MHARCFDIITDALTNARLRRQESVRKLENREAEPRNMVAEREREKERERERGRERECRQGKTSAQKN